MKKIIVLTILVFSELLFAKKGEITLSSAVEVSPREVLTAYDMVETKNVSEDTLNILKEIHVADQNTKFVKRDDLIRKFRSVDSFFMLPAEVKILRSRSNVSRMELERKIKNFLTMKCSSCEFTIQINSVPQAMTSDWDLDLNVDLNKSTVMIPVFSLSAPEKKGWVVAELKKYAQVPVLNRSLRIGDSITEDSITTEKRQVMGLQDTIMDKRSLIGMQAAKFLNAGQTVANRDIKREQVLRKGQIVKALFGKDNFEVSISAQAEEAGAIGDVVRVKNLDSQKLFAAKIIDRGVVQIE